MGDDEKTLPKSSSLPWYRDGLRFKCTECGKCCTGSPGYVWVSEEEIAELAELLRISVARFKKKYVRSWDGRQALIEKKTLSGEYDCVFLKDKKCQVYQARPRQCRTFPWWDENLKSEESWKLAAAGCEGIDGEAPLVSYEHIEAMRQSQGEG